MDDEKKRKGEGTKERIGYGVKIPAISFEEAIRITREVSKVGGSEGSVDALSKVTGNSASSSTFTYKVRALKAFGLLSLQDNIYALTDAGKHIAQPESAEQETQAIVDAFSRQELLNRVWEYYKGKILPQSEYLANYFEKSYGIPASLKKAWAQYFVEAAGFAGLLHEREGGSFQVLLAPAIKVNVVDAVHLSDKADASLTPKPIDTKGQLPSFSIETTQWGILNQRKLSGDRKAIFAIPDELTKEDIDVLRVMLKGIDAGLDGLRKFEQN
jgi:hypothetical protein